MAQQHSGIERIIEEVARGDTNLLQNPKNIKTLSWLSNHFVDVAIRHNVTQCKSKINTMCFKNSFINRDRLLNTNYSFKILDFDSYFLPCYTFYWM